MSKDSRCAGRITCLFVQIIISFSRDHTPMNIINLQRYLLALMMHDEVDLSTATSIATSSIANYVPTCVMRSSY